MLIFLASQTSIIGNNNFDFAALFNSQQSTEKINENFAAKNNNINETTLFNNDRALHQKNINNSDELIKIICDNSNISNLIISNIVDFKNRKHHLNKIKNNQLVDIIKIECPNCDEFISKHIWFLKDHLKIVSCFIYYFFLLKLKL